MSEGIAHTLTHKYDLYGNSIVVHTTNLCSVYLLGETEESESPYYVALNFEGVKCIRSVRSDCRPGLGIYPEDERKSYIVELTNSTWASEAHSSYTYEGTPFTDEKRHFVIHNHDIFHEILGTSFIEKLISEGSEEYSCLLYTSPSPRDATLSRMPSSA